MWEIMEPIWSVILSIHEHSHAPFQTSHRYSGPGSVKSRTTSTRCSKSETRDEQNPKTFHGDQVNHLWNLFYYDIVFKLLHHDLQQN